MRKHAHLPLALALALLSMSQTARSVDVSDAYISRSATEIRGQLGQYASPTIYVDQNACGEPSPNAMACSPTVISVGSQFLQDQESQYGNYVAKMVLAHEWGHTIQFSYNIDNGAPYNELQADCTGGSFVRYAKDNLRYASFLSGAASSARAAADYAEHGTPAQRDYYTRWGYANGVLNCFNRLPRV
ncbi:putative metalloprotease [Oxalobacteraceae bacterium GrIS 1.11]